MLFVLLALLSFAAAAEDDWFSICTKTEDVAKYCTDEKDRGEVYSCLAEEYNNDQSPLTKDCREKMYERAQKAKKQAEDEVEKNDWAYLCSSELEAKCDAEAPRGEQWKCLASAYKSDKSDLSSQCIGAIEARSSRAQSNWGVLCQSEIQAACSEVTEEADIFPCLAAKVEEDAMSISGQCSETLEDLWKQMCIPDMQQMCPEATEKLDQIKCLMKDPEVLQASCTATLRVLRDVLSAQTGEVQPRPVAAAPVGISSTETSKPPAPKRPVGPPAGFNPAGPQAPATAVQAPPQQCPLLADFTVKKCPKKVRLGWGFNAKGFCKPLRGCRFQRKLAKKQQFFRTRKACAKARKRCNN